MKECTQCGKCCINYSNGRLAASADEIELWRDFNPEIYTYVNNGNIWCDPTTGKQLELCPFLNENPDTHKYTCDIYLDRPEDCRHYPTMISEMIRDECEMIEIQDVTHPKRAQKKLDKLMADSRPAFGS
ncbi:YkgJ family cysteine cluster protein [Pseudoalteromonas denitrificans]|uniref:Fe-S-cluster containining protein n=1 Tax=Pseudoalteromonas denitrificans DSM 6059 TaxID=1123010 RepID=A0A1I1Q811_9GAMM|nr:YkgJ family cysteine cluster protein [Pseudoalteromonas denitrificans]SFD18296.1 Fe-S-cluster containining protein [Pseudoalteromonas denitrificans DSM 6059]